MTAANTATPLTDQPGPTARTTSNGSNVRPTVTVVGGGIAGLVAAIELAEAGMAVRLLEARSRLGGRATSGPSPWVTNLGPHALYASTELWTWLRDRDLHRPSATPRSFRLAFCWEGRASRVPPWALLRAAARLAAHEAPVDVDLQTWATGRWGPDTARALAGLAAPLIYDHDPGRLSAAFVAPRIRDFLRHQPTRARYAVGGWGGLVERMVAHAQAVGVEVEADVKVDASALDDLRRRGPVIVAVGLGAARRLLGTDAAPDDDRRVALLDVGLERRRADPFLIWDLDQVVFSTRPSAIVSGLAPEGHDLVQLSVGMAPGEDLDAADDGWRDRTVWRRRAAVRASTGAVDLPGTTWRDRPPVDRGDGLWVVGDWVAAPGHLAEVSATSAIGAARAVQAAIEPRVWPMASAVR